MNPEDVILSMPGQPDNFSVTVLDNNVVDPRVALGKRAVC